MTRTTPEQEGPAIVPTGAVGPGSPAARARGRVRGPDGRDPPGAMMPSVPIEVYGRARSGAGTPDPRPRRTMPGTSVDAPNRLSGVGLRAVR